MRLWLGGYTSDMDGDGDGISVLLAGEAAEQSARGALSFAGTAVEVASPSWLAAHPTLPVVYAALEGQGAVQAFRRAGEQTLEAFGPARPVGALTCHVAVSPDGMLAVATAYGDGNVAFIPLGIDGSLGEPRVKPLPTDPYADAAPVAEAALPGVSASGFLIAAAEPEPEPTELASAADALRAAVGEQFADLIPDYGTDSGDEFARFLASQQLREDDDATRAARVAAELIAQSKDARNRPTTDIPALDLPKDDASATAADPAVRVPHAHQARFLTPGLVATTDLGFDLVRFWKRGERGYSESQRVVLPKGSGPRHMVWHPSGHLHVVTEYSCEVFTLAPDRTGRWTIVSATPVSREAVVGFDFPAELSLSREATQLYAGIRGSNTLATLAVKDNGARLVPVAAVASDVDWPRHHVLVGDTLLVAGQRSNEVVSFAIDERTQVPAARRSRTEAPTPTVLVPVFD